MVRSIYKGPYIEHSLIRKIQKMRARGVDLMATPIRTYSRSSTIVPGFIGFTFEVHNGKRFIKVYITQATVGKKLGEFSPTRTFVKHSGDVKQAVVRNVSKKK